MEFLVLLPILLFSAILHEIAHGYVAERLGDPTARLMGRLTLNPLKHIDPYMSILMPLVTWLVFKVPFGGAKPVPVDPFNLREGRKDMAIVALSGPLTNILIAIASALIFKSLSHILGQDSFFSNLFYFITVINLLLATLNLVPIPPLDGSKVFSLILPEREANQYLALGNIGLFLIIILLMSPLGGFSLSGFIRTILSFSLNLLGLPAL